MGLLLRLNYSRVRSRSPIMFSIHQYTCRYSPSVCANIFPNDIRKFMVYMYMYLVWRVCRVCIYTAQVCCIERVCTYMYVVWREYRVCIYMYMYMLQCIWREYRVHVHIYIYTCTCTCTCMLYGENTEYMYVCCSAEWAL